MPILSHYEGALVWWQRRRDSALAPITRRLDQYQVSPNAITALALAVMATSFTGAIWINAPWLAIFGLWLQLLIDGLDGPLARQSSRSSRRKSLTGRPRLDTRGTLVDAGADYLSVVMQGAYLIIFTSTKPTVALIYIVLHGLLIALALYRLSKQIPYLVLIRPRLAVLFVLSIDVIYDTNISAPVIIGAIGLLLIFLGPGLVAIITSRSVGSRRGQDALDPPP